MEIGRTVIPIAYKNVSHAFKSGVKVALGTDSGVYAHGLNGHEFAKMVEMGLTPLQSIQAGTVNAANVIGWADKIGTIEAGIGADLIVVDGDPLRKCNCARAREVRDEGRGDREKRICEMRIGKRSENGDQRSAIE